MTSDEPKYQISVIAQMLDVHPQTLRTYERMGLVMPPRSAGNTRRFSDRNIEEIRSILNLTRELGVNLAGVEVVFRMKQQICEMQQEITDFVLRLKACTTDLPPDAVAVVNDVLSQSDLACIRQALDAIDSLGGSTP